MYGNFIVRIFLAMFLSCPGQDWLKVTPVEIDQF